MAVAALALLALLPQALGQHNSSYVDYNVEANPDLFPQCLDTISLSFPDCQSGPLSKNLVCDSTASPYDRAAALVSLFTLEELIANTGNTSPGVPRLGLPPYQVWSEALHGLGRANFTDNGALHAGRPSFPSPILSAAAFNRTLINQIASIISTQGRAFNNAGRFGLDVYSPNINTFRHPVWGRGQETPGEDAYTLTAAYAYEYITGIQGGVNPEHLKLAATAKHFAGYDIENWDNHSRLGNDVNITQQDLAEYYTPQFLVAARDAHVHSFMCSYNAVNGVPSCSNTFFLQTLLRDTFSFVDHGYVSGDCGAVYGVFNPHGYAANEPSAAADAILAGTDIDCGTSYQYHFNESITTGAVARDDIERGFIRLYANLVELGYFDGNSSSSNPYRSLGWPDVQKTDAWNISYEAAVEGIVLLKNDGTLPLASPSEGKNKSIALIGPWANATTQLQGNYYGDAPYLISPVDAFTAAGYTVHYAPGTEISTNSTANFSAALSAARAADTIVFLGGIDNTIEAEAQDRSSIAWPGNQLELISQLAAQKSDDQPLVVYQMGGGQVDSSSLKFNAKVNALLWGGYPGQSGGLALRDILTGARAPAGRLTTTQYPAAYAESFSALDMNLRPNETTQNPGQTYMWYTGEPVYAFGHGLFYTTFNASSAQAAKTKYTFNITDLTSAAHPDTTTVGQRTLFNFTASITNSGQRDSDYTALVYANTSTAGPSPYPNKWLVGFDRLAAVAKEGGTAELNVPVAVDRLARVDEAGNTVLFPGRYEVALNNEREVVVEVELVGEQVVLLKWPEEVQGVAGDE
uniref:Probable exo-1,4-beta-xylosidase xlnD n=1 Tax=Aspergillus aculeatus TaxID=5053 RepID=XYND_ASPAC|nr:RecName: Full=Probable exo-1,4-beta-xylosidase xlnD; AltName: Full=1,4-beta-D-xylan xylohydrolase xlnD; AltName: Full=Beta-xylosidase A; AltName: Full=Beta-xylosidase xlnD; AltName: Full=Xylobiase xlnD; Flags: Precursor [Aspergillus aculeatus]BAH30675.1 beta-xylosidase [Aspergillus aculeatus]